MNKAKIEKTLREGDGSLAFAYFSVLLPILKLGKEGQDKKLHFCSESHSIMSDSLGPHRLYSSWNSPGQNTGVGSLSLLQWIFLSQVSNWGLLHCRRILYQLSYQGSPYFDKSCTLGGFPGRPVVKTWPSYAGGACLIPGCGTKIPHAS